MDFVYIPREQPAQRPARLRRGAKNPLQQSQNMVFVVHSVAHAGTIFQRSRGSLSEITELMACRPSFPLRPTSVGLCRFRALQQRSKCKQCATVNGLFPLFSCCELRFFQQSHNQVHKDAGDGSAKPGQPNSRIPVFQDAGTFTHEQQPRPASSAAP